MSQPETRKNLMMAYLAFEKQRLENKCIRKPSEKTLKRNLEMKAKRDNGASWGDLSRKHGLTVTGARRAVENAERFLAEQERRASFVREMDDIAMSLRQKDKSTDQ